MLLTITYILVIISMEGNIMGSKSTVPKTMTGKELVRLLEKNGWVVIRTRGSHCTLKKDGEQPVTVPVHTKELSDGLLKAILKRTGIK